jgi:hypothetical protein
LLDLPAPGLSQDGGGPTIESSAPEPDASDATIDTAAEAEPDRAVQDTAAQDTNRDTAADTAAPDVAPDVESDASGWVLCSFNGSKYCDPEGGTPDCCETATDSSNPSFACVPKDMCGTGYDIKCTSASLCPGSDICCHYASGMRCEPPMMPASDCPGGGGVTQACDPDASGECASGLNCTLQLLNNTLPSPYWGCQ